MVLSTIQRLVLVRIRLMKFTRVQKLGHKCFIASGRPTGFISKEVKSIGFDGFVLANGAHIVTEGKNNRLFNITL